MTETETEDDGQKRRTVDGRTVIVQTRTAHWAQEGNPAHVPVNKIPGLNAANITSGTFLIARLPNHFVENVQEMKDQGGSIIIILGQLEKRIAQLEERK